MKNLLITSIRNQALLAVDAEKRLTDIKKASQATLTVLNEKTKVIKARIESIKLLKIEVFEQYNDNLISKDEFLSKKKNYSVDIDNLSNELSNIDKEIQSCRDDMNKNSSLNIFEHYRNIVEVSREILADLLDKVIVYQSGMIEIKWSVRSIVKKDIFFGFCLDTH